jgi:hypothetical protein
MYLDSYQAVGELGELRLDEFLLRDPSSRAVVSSPIEEVLEKKLFCSLRALLHVKP